MGAFSLLCTVLAVAGGDAGEKKNPATTPMNRDVARHKQFLEIAKKRKRATSRSCFSATRSRRAGATMPPG
ncbi:MAG TPA: hypothetical protein VEL76_28815, partial [Gemmataceae bacterium]|nr:hypothetical protein [Gemmataceae bacterium]